MLQAHLSFRSADASIAKRWGLDALAGELTQSESTDGALVKFDEIESDLRRAKQVGRAARFAGFVSYELNRAIESLPPVRSTRDLPVLAFWKIDNTIDFFPDLYELAGTIVGRSMSRSAYLTAVRRAIEYIAAGDIFQVNVTQAFSVQTSMSPLSASLTLHHQSPANYGALIHFGDTAILSNSPELFFRIEPLADGRRRITTRPIKGTRPRGPGMREELERSDKDRAELAMIVDLERNDLGRICEIGSVRVVEPRVIEPHPTVYHGVATIEGFLRPEVTLADVFRAMFPCGSITGCPKVRAMQIIDELETEPRGPYCGAIGYVDSDGSAEFSVAIRTMTIRDGIARVHVGGGIVADSDPVEEHRETIVKARAMLRALGVSEADIDALDDA